MSLQYGWLKPPKKYAWTKGPLLDDDAGTVSHVYWRNGVLVDTKSLAWAVNGSITMVDASGAVPPGAGGFSTSNFYKLTNPNAINSLAGGNFSICVVMWRATTGAQEFLSAGGWGTAGGGFDLYTSTTANLRNNSASVGAAAMDSGTGSGSIHVVCAGINGANAVVKADLKTAVTGAITFVANVGNQTRIGLGADGGRPPDGTVLEVLCTSTAASDAQFTAWMNAVKTKIPSITW